MGVRAARRSKRRQDILETGLELFVRQGVAATKTGDIAAAAGMSAGLLFHYFASRDALHEALLALALAAAHAALAPPECPPLPFFEQTAQRALAAAADPFAARLFVLLGQAWHTGAPPAAQPGMQALTDAARFAARIEAGQVAGAIRPGNSAALAAAFAHALLGAAQAAVFCPQTPPPEAAWLADILRARREDALAL